VATSGTDGTSAGKMFAAATGIARSSIALCFDRGTIGTLSSKPVSAVEVREEVHTKDTTALNCAGVERQAPPDGTMLFTPVTLPVKFTSAVV